MQKDRAREAGRGRAASQPWRIPWRGWKDIFWRAYAGFNDNRLLAVAAGVVFYGVLALFPTVAAFVSLYGLFADASSVNDHLSLAAGFLPAGALDIIRDQVNRLTAHKRRRARLRLPRQLGGRALERQFRHEGDH